MNKKADSSARNKIFLGFWFVLFATLILTANWIFMMPVNNAEKIMANMAETQRQITRLTAIHAEYLLSTDKEDNILTIKDQDFEHESKQIVNHIKSNIKSLQDRRSISRKAGGALDEYSTILESLESDLTNLILITRERGNKRSGIVNRWLQLSQGMSSIADQKTLTRLQNIKTLESEYLLNRNLRTLEDISVAAEDIRNQISGESTININDIDSYIVLTGNLASIEKRMGHNALTGIVPEMEASLEKLPASFATIQKLVSDHLHKVRIGWVIARYIVIIMVIGFFVYLFVYVFSLVDPLRQMAGFAAKLSSGEFPDDDIAAGSLADLESAKLSLKKHVATLKDKFRFTKELNEDTLDGTLEIAGENDELGHELVRLQQKISANKKQQEKNEQDNLVRRYMNEGLAKFAEILRSKNNDIVLLGDAFIREIVKYLNALQGGFFIYDDTDPENPVLKMISAFAYNRKKYLQQTIRFGEGLVGTCARERQYMNFTEIPEGYITITSGLGDTAPNNLLLVPVLHENEILGVIEIASLNVLRPHEIEFAKEVALSLGSTLVNTRNNQRTTELLAKSQQQALEMAEQEEEMRQNMEELKATQEESSRREEESWGITEALNNALMVAEYDLEGKILRANQNLCFFLGKEIDQVTGRTHYSVFEGSLNPDSTFWQNLGNKGYATETENIKIGKKTYQTVNRFATVTNRNGMTVKFINFISDGRTGNS